MDLLRQRIRNSVSTQAIRFGFTPFFFLIGFLFFIFSVSKKPQSSQNLREILSITTARFREIQGPVKVVKLQVNRGVQIEIYSKPQGASFELIGEFVFPATRDGFFDTAGFISNLAIFDSNGDGENEILVPVMKSTTEAELHRIEFVKELGKFRLIL